MPDIINIASFISANLLFTCFMFIPFLWAVLVLTSWPRYAKIFVSGNSCQKYPAEVLLHFFFILFLPPEREPVCVRLLFCRFHAKTKVEKRFRMWYTCPELLCMEVKKWVNVKDNPNFRSVALYRNIPIQDVVSVRATAHLRFERHKKLCAAFRKNRERDGSQACVDRTFLVDKGHPDGLELHLVTCRGIIFILNEQKYRSGGNAFITALYARPGQASRLYRAAGLKLPEDIWQWCRHWQGHRKYT